jgi:hypothetical protein
MSADFAAFFLASASSFLLSISASGECSTAMILFAGPRKARTAEYPEYPE